ncbi:hypothetical protein [Spirosoma montaniterrae]|uniref:HTH luxR-type domain-containing protein n=1 Tax=Spirosoma montaniterrae TaxID=1178516 RepID=A0A1P9WZP1_9BACT|nr:hypothetical protein [Spirosoma montaniterrae]AQG80849.1 hypothetical protein AWR27_16905 [Spirosoma montaniterrae]
MSRLFRRFFATIPPELDIAFRQTLILAILVRLRWMFWLGIFFQIVQFSTDWVRYREGSLFTDPVHRNLLLTHIASASLVIAYGLTIREKRAIQQGQLARAERWLAGITFFFALYGLPRSAFAYVDRQTMVMFIYYVLVSQIIFMVGHRVRIILTGLSIGIMTPTVWLFRTGTFAERYISLLEVVLFTLAIFALATHLYNLFIREFVQNRLIEDQHEALKKQARQLEEEQKRAVQELEQRSQELISYVLQEQQRNAFLLELKERITTTDPDRLTRLIDYQLNQEDRWKYFVVLFERLHPLFFARIQSAYPTLNTYDIRLIALLKLNLSTKEISALLGISPQSANTARYRLRKRLDLDPDASLETFLQQY